MLPILTPPPCRLGPHNAQLKGEFGQRDSPLMRQLTLQAAARPDVLEGVTAEVALVKLCMGHLETLGNLGVWAHSPPDALDRLRCRGLQRARHAAPLLRLRSAQRLPAAGA